jgi:hypothetical protein
MLEFEKTERVKELWKNVIGKLKGAVMILNRFGDLNRRLYLYGKKNLLL